MPESKVVTLSRRGTRPRGEKTRQKILAATLRAIRNEIRRIVGWIVNSD